MTIRVSLTDDPVKEIYAAKDILKAVGKGSGIKIVAPDRVVNQMREEIRRLSSQYEGEQ